MLLQTNSYIVPKDKRAEHARLLRRFRAALAKLGCDSFEVYEQVGANWNTGEPTGRYVQIMRFRDRRHQVAVQQAERSDPVAQAIIAEFCQLINFPYQQQQGLFAVGFYNGVLPVAPARPQAGEGAAAVQEPEAVAEPEAIADSESAIESQVAPPTDPVEEPAAATNEEPVAVESVDDVMAEPEASREDSAEGSNSTAADEEAAPADDTPARDDEPHGETPDDLGALLDAHLAEPIADDTNDTAHPLDESSAGDDAPAGLDALDLDELDMPDQPSDAERSPRHVAQ